MFKLNKKGFTLVELLAVIVVLAIIIIIAMPNVLRAMNNARTNSLKVYAQKVFTQAQAQYNMESLSDSFTDGTLLVSGVRCYNLQQLQMEATGSYRGYVTIELNQTGGTDVYKIWLSDGNASIRGATSNEVDKLKAGDAGFKTPFAVSAVTSACNISTT